MTPSPTRDYRPGGLRPTSSLLLLEIETFPPITDPSVSNHLSTDDESPSALRLRLFEV